MLFFSLFAFSGIVSIGKKIALLFAAKAGLQANVEEDDECL